jgi:hypothetical protein
MKKEMLLCAIVVGTMICSSQVIAQDVKINAKETSSALSLKQLKIWMFSERSTSASSANPYLTPNAVPLRKASREQDDGQLTTCDPNQPCCIGRGCIN